MAEDYGTPIAPAVEPQKKDNKVLIIVIVVLLLLCCCCFILSGVIWAGWTYGDTFLNYYSQVPQLVSMLV